MIVNRIRVKPIPFPRLLFLPGHSLGPTQTPVEYQGPASPVLTIITFSPPCLASNNLYTFQNAALHIYMPFLVKAPTHVPSDLSDSSPTQAKKMQQPRPVHFVKEEARCGRVKWLSQGQVAFQGSRGCLKQKAKPPSTGSRPGLSSQCCQTRRHQSLRHICNHISQKRGRPASCHHLLKGPRETYA